MATRSNNGPLPPPVAIRCDPVFFVLTIATAAPVAVEFASLPAMHHHWVYSGDEEVVIDLSFYGPFQIHYVNPSDDPSRKP